MLLMMESGQGENVTLLPQVTLQGYLVASVALHLSQDPLVIESVGCFVHFWMKVVVLFEELKLGWSVSVEGAD